jgi:hypothetical protein
MKATEPRVCGEGSAGYCRDFVENQGMSGISGIVTISEQETGPWPVRLLKVETLAGSWFAGMFYSSSQTRVMKVVEEYLVAHWKRQQSLAKLCL